MVENIVNGIVNGGLKKYSKKFQSLPEDTQIRVYFNDLKVVYDVCVNFQPKEKVSFRDILDSKFDLLGFEPKATPIFVKTLTMFSEQYDCPPTDISVFIFKKNRIGIAVYKKLDHIHTNSLSNHLRLLEI